MCLVAYILLIISASVLYISVAVPHFVDPLAKARTPITFLGYSTTGVTQLISTTLIAYKAWYAALMNCVFLLLADPK